MVENHWGSTLLHLYTNYEALSDGFASHLSPPQSLCPPLSLQTLHPANHLHLTLGPPQSSRTLDMKHKGEIQTLFLFWDKPFMKLCYVACKSCPSVRTRESFSRKWEMDQDLKQGRTYIFSMYGSVMLDDTLKTRKNVDTIIIWLCSINSMFYIFPT